MTRARINITIIMIQKIVHGRFRNGFLNIDVMRIKEHDSSIKILSTFVYADDLAIYHRYHAHDSEF